MLILLWVTRFDGRTIRVDKASDRGSGGGGRPQGAFGAGGGGNNFSGGYGRGQSYGGRGGTGMYAGGRGGYQPSPQLQNPPQYRQAPAGGK
ncbi:MAG: hypothetical protein Q9159_000539 [Coniocarpon cinnabarinum]